MKYYKILGRASCPYCCKACEALSQQKENFMFCEMEMSPQLISYFKEVYGMSTVPIVLEISPNGDSKLIGGCTDLIEYLGVNNG